MKLAYVITCNGAEKERPTRAFFFFFVKTYGIPYYTNALAIP